jgi:hypothetical protein
LFTIGLLQGVPRFSQLLQHRVLHTDACVSLKLSPDVLTHPVHQLLYTGSYHWLRPDPAHLISEPRWQSLTRPTDVRWVVGPVDQKEAEGWCYTLTLPTTCLLAWFVMRLEHQLPNSVVFQLSCPPSNAGRDGELRSYTLELVATDSPVGSCPPAAFAAPTVAVQAALLHPSSVSRLIWEGVDATIDVSQQRDGNLLNTKQVQIAPDCPQSAHTIHIQLYRPPKLVSWVWTLMAVTDRCLSGLQTPSVHLVENVYGVVMARLTLEVELFKMLSQVKPIQRRHCRIIANWMTYNGTVQPMQLSTLHQRCSSLFKQTSFEKNAAPFITNPLTCAQDDGHLILSRQMLGMNSGSGTDARF